MSKRSNPIYNTVSFLIVALLFSFYGEAALAQDTAFTYQGRLTDGGGPATGQYDLQFQIFAALSGGTALGTVQKDNEQVTNGIFSVQLNFGAVNFNNNGARFLEIGVRPFDQTGAYSVLTPRQQITSTPYAIRSLNAATADGLSVACVNCVTSIQISSVSGSQVSGLIPLASVPDLSLSYVQNKTSPAQTSADFNIDGNGAVGGTLTGNVVNSATQYNIGGNRVFSIGGLDNLFACINAGFSNTTGSDNSFVGLQTGQANTSGSFNSFVGTAAGIANTMGSKNAFFGDSTGFTNTTGSNNTIIGSFANVGAPNLNFATALGSGAVVSSNNTVTLGRAADTVQIPGVLNVAGATGANIVNATTQYNIGGNRVLSVPGINNTFAGVSAGAANTTGIQLILW